MNKPTANTESRSGLRQSEANPDFIHLSEIGQHRILEQIRQNDSQLFVIVFTDLVASTETQQRLGDSAASQLFQRHRSLVENLAEIDSGRVIDWTGDGCFLLFSKPSAAVRFALCLQSKTRRIRLEDARFPQVRVGIHIGEILLNQLGGPTGLNISLAARVLELAHANQILCTSTVYDTAAHSLKDECPEELGELDWKVHGPFEVKGVDRELRICEVGERNKAPFIAPAQPRLKSLDENTPDPSDEDPGWPLKKSPATLSRRRREPLLVLSLAIVLALAYATWQFLPDKPVVNQPGVDLSSRRAAILPFSTEAADPELEWVGRGVAEAVTGEVAASTVVSLVERIQVDKVLAELEFEQTDWVDPATAQAIGRLLGVQWVVIGSVQINDDAVRITARTVDTESARIMDSLQRDGTRQSLFDLQTEFGVALRERLDGLAAPDQP